MISRIVPPSVDADAFAKAMAGPPVTGIRLNRRKCSDVAALGYGDPEQVPWCDDGYYLEERPVFTLNPLLHAGAFYVQDPSSMIYQRITEEILKKTGNRANLAVLDLCAAPGGKSTAMINALPDDAVVVSNEVVGKRSRILQENLLKWGFPGSMVTNSPTSDFASLGEIFDIVAVDAPCSGEGMMRKDETAVAQWSPGLVRQCAAMQREILSDAVDALRPGGYLIYSTCTFNLSENEENLAWLVEETGMEPVAMDFPKGWGIAPAISPSFPALRFMPHLLKGEGLFAALLRKPGELTPRKKEAVGKAMARLSRKVRVLPSPFAGQSDTNAAPAKKECRHPKKNQNKEIERPDPTLPLSTAYVRGSYPEAELGAAAAVAYLRHEAVTLPADTPKGYVVVTYKGVPLGFVKNLGNRANNLYPSEWRIRMQDKNE